MKGITPEQVRILRAARDGRLRVNGNGRYEIEGELSPDRRERERLMHRDLLPRGQRTPVPLTMRGEDALAVAPRLPAEDPA